MARPFWRDRFLDTVERAGNVPPDPVSDIETAQAAIGILLPVVS